MRVLYSPQDRAGWASNRRKLQRSGYLGSEHARVRAVRNEVRSAPTGAMITFLDHLAHHGHTLTHRCEQHLEFDEAGRICRILHVDLPGEREALAAFFKTLGITRA